MLRCRIAMQILASDAVENVRSIPLEFWWKAALFVAIFVGAILAVRRIKRMNKVVLAVVVLVICSIIWFNWIYQRNEPAFMTPIVEKVAPFFPTKGKHPGT